MYRNIGGKLKGLAQAICWIGIIVSVVGGIILIATADYNDTMVITGVLVIVLGSLFSWVGSFALYGFGELVENSDIRTNLAIKQDRERSASARQD